VCDTDNRNRKHAATFSTLIIIRKRVMAAEWKKALPPQENITFQNI